MTLLKIILVHADKLFLFGKNTLTIRQLHPDIPLFSKSAGKNLICSEPY
jgi:hypothetical protein